MPLRWFATTLVLLGLVGCGDSSRQFAAEKAALESEVASLRAARAKAQAENAALKKELEEIKFGAERIVAEVEAAYAAQRYTEVKKGIKALASRHPTAAKNAEFAVLLQTIEAEEERQAAHAAAAEKAKREKAAAEEKERNRLANLNNTGMWEVQRYVDKFGNPTDQKYVTNKRRIEGTFSNSATQDSPLGVDFLINSTTEVALMLYEYDGKNPVKAYSDKSYQLAVLDKDGKELNYTGVNYSDRIVIDLKQRGDAFHAALKRGGTVKFRVREADRSPTSYAFDVRMPDEFGYENALRLLTAK